MAYHDAEWGVLLVDDVGLFEFLTLEGAQAGLSWSTILNKRAAYRAAFAGFDPERVAIQNRWRSLAELPAQTPESRASVVTSAWPASGSRPSSRPFATPGCEMTPS